MDSESAKATTEHHPKLSEVQPPAPPVAGIPSSTSDTQSSSAPTSGFASWARLKLPLTSAAGKEDSHNENAAMSTFARFTSGFGLLSSKPATPEEGAEGTVATTQTGVLESFTKGLVDSSRNAVKTVQVKARHLVSQNKRRYQEGGFDLDMTYITENVIAMGFPAGDLSSGFFFGYVEGFYRNHMEEVIKFFETHHKDRYKVYNLCSERLYDPAVFEGKVACFPFDDHNCPPIQLLRLFCESAHSWLKADSQNVVVVHCKAGMARTGLMICSLLVYLKLFPTADEVIDYYNQKRCVDGKGIVLPSQIRYVKYFERLLTQFNGEIPPGRRCMLRGFRLHKCPYWIRPSITISNHNGILFTTKKHPKTKDLMPEDFWINSPKKGVVIFALPGEPGVTELAGDFKIQFHDRQGDFYCWLNTTMTENRTLLSLSDLDGFDKRKLPSPGFQLEVVMVDYDSITTQKPNADSAAKGSSGSSSNAAPNKEVPAKPNNTSNNQDKDDVFSDSDGEDSGSTKTRQAHPTTTANTAGSTAHDSNVRTTTEQMGTLTHATEQVSLQNNEPRNVTSPKSNYGAADSTGGSHIKAMAADASVFSFGDDEDFESD